MDLSFKNALSSRLAALSFRFKFLLSLAALFLAINLLVRLIFPFLFPETLSAPAHLAAAALIGVINDCAALVFVLLLPAALILLPSDRFLASKLGEIYRAAIAFFFAASFIFCAFAEYFFWEEFGSRFNFIAVDYLVYTTEVVRNIVESYPLAPLFAAVFVLSAIAAAAICLALRNTSPLATPSSFKTRAAKLAAFAAIAIVVFFAFSPIAPFADRHENQFARNGVYELFSAYRNNQLDFGAFYKTIDSAEAFKIVQADLAKQGAASFAGADNLVRFAAGDAEIRPNVVLVIMESMGSVFLGELTPNINKIAAQGLSFSNMRSTGTRTVRGIEAAMLSLPPTPGNSIVRRQNNGDLFSLATPFKDRGYDLAFIYGGIGFFDNMNEFFGANGYEINDKLSFKNKTFANAWGQCDEDLYAESLRLADASFAEKKPFHQVLLTTSNHRPYTFPAGKIDMPNGSRQAAVKYADFAIGRYIEAARQKAWFENTIFVFMGDHPASIAGGTDLPPNAYGIVAVMFAPKFFAPEKIETLVSQIDIAPTLLAAIGWGYETQFFGTDARKLPREEGRAWISTYQLLGYRTNDFLVILRPNAEVEAIALAADSAKPPIDKAIAYYQTAFDLWSGGKLKHSFVKSFIK